MKKYNEFILEKLTNNQTAYINRIIDFLTRKSNFKFYEYAEEFDVKKDNYPKKLYGKLYFFDSNKAIRFNFDNETLKSIDMWNNFYFINADKICDKPDLSLIIQTSVVKDLNQILNFIKGKKLNEDNDITPDDENVVDAEIENQDINNTEKNDVSDVKIEEAPDEKVDLKSLGFSNTVLEQDMDIFESMKLFVSQVAFKVSKSLLILGSGGLGKSYTVFSTIQDMGIKYIKISGSVSTPGLYELLFLNRKSLIVFDDADNLWDDTDSVNYLKAILDTNSKSEISSIKKGNYFNAFGLSDEDIERKYKELGRVKLPNQFVFSGNVIFISNRSVKSFDEATLTRCLYVDISLTKEQIINRIKKIMSTIKPNVSMSVKENTLKFVDYLTSNFICNFPLNLRTFILSLEIRISNEFNTVINGESIPAWQFLIKQYLLKPRT